MVAFNTLEQDTQSTSKFNGKYAEKDNLGGELSLHILKYVRNQSAITDTSLKSFWI